MTYVTSPILGVSPDTTYAGTTVDGAGAPFTLGQTVMATDGKELVFVQAGEAISTTTTA